jgi:nucleoside-diphosphate-sugar epimerase
MTQPHLFCFGLGYSALTLADRLLDKGWRISGTCRTSEKCDTLRPMGITAHLFDKELPLYDESLLQQATHILISIPPDESQGDLVLAYHKELLEKLPLLQWVGYLSTTGVYGNHDGQWVNEETPVNPPNDRSKRRVEAETQWLEADIPACIFRLSGIYGKGRSALEALKEGTAKRIDKEGQVFSRIHVEDIATILEASMEKPLAGQIYNCADDVPAPQADVVLYAAELLGVAPPPLVGLEEANLSEMALSFYQQNRRVSNQKVKEELAVTFAYSSYKEGLKASL